MREWWHGTFTEVSKMSKYKELGYKARQDKDVQFAGMNGVQIGCLCTSRVLSGNDYYVGFSWDRVVLEWHKKLI